MDNYIQPDCQRSLDILFLVEEAADDAGQPSSKVIQYAMQPCKYSHVDMRLAH